MRCAFQARDLAGGALSVHFPFSGLDARAAEVFVHDVEPARRGDFKGREGSVFPGFRNLRVAVPPNRLVIGIFGVMTRVLRQKVRKKLLSVRPKRVNVPLKPKPEPR